MKTTYVITTLLLSVYLFGACTNSNRRNDTVKNAENVNERKTALNDDISDFMVKAASSGMMEVELGKIAKQKSQNQRVKNFGAMMIRDHEKTNNELKTLASSKKITLPTTMGEDLQNKVTDLSSRKGSDFDKEYMYKMVDDHKDNINLFERASRFEDTDVSAFANKTLPVLRSHLDSAEAINNTLKNKNRNNSSKNNKNSSDTARNKQ